MRTTVRIGFIPAAALVVLLGLGGGVIAGAASTTTVPDPYPVKAAPGGPAFAGGQAVNDAPAVAVAASTPVA